MRPLSLLFAALLLAPTACSRKAAAPPLPVATAQEPALPLAVAAPEAAAPSPAPAEPDPKPTPEEVAAFHAKVPK